MRKYLTIEHSTHFLILLFTLTSWANIRAFLIGAGHDWLAAALLSGALGAALAVISLALTKIDSTTERPTFRALVTVGAGLALLSGALQSAEYATHLSGLWPYVLGYTVPLLGEIGLSLASSLFSRAQRRAELRSVNAKIEAAITDNLDQAIASFDPSTIQKRIDKALNRVALAAVGGVESNLLAVYGDNQPPTTEALPDKGADGTADNTHNVPSTDDLSAARTDKKNQRMAAVFRLIQCGDRPLSAIADEVGVSEKTITRYINQLREQGHTVTVNGVCKVGA